MALDVGEIGCLAELVVNLPFDGGEIGRGIDLLVDPQHLAGLFELLQIAPQRLVLQIARDRSGFGRGFFLSHIARVEIAALVHAAHEAA